MSNFKLTFTLKQHTPLIHFQADQPGATLRASELKPKFDRFLKKYVFNNEVPREYKVNENKDALDYKVKIEPNNSFSREIGKNPLFFGNMGEGKEKKFKISDTPFKIEFFTFNKEIKQAIERYFEAFLANTNFGTRQSKGFGSFYINDKNLDIALIPFRVYSFQANDWQRDIELFYKFLRQGINLPRNRYPFYCKPAIFSYAKNKGWQWEKKTIKEKFFNHVLKNQIKIHNNSDILTFSSSKKYLLRDLFGLSSSQKWEKDYKAIITKVGKNKEKDEKNKNEKVKVERFKSPITFKVVNGIVYFWVNDSYKLILNEPFYILKNGDEKNKLELSTPLKFDFNEFLNFTINDINLKTHIEEKFHKAREFETLQRILQDIRANL